MIAFIYVPARRRMTQLKRRHIALLSARRQVWEVNASNIQGWKHPFLDSSTPNSIILTGLDVPIVKPTEHIQQLLELGGERL